MKKTTAALSLLIAVIIAVSFTGCSLFGGIINATVPDYAARHPEIIEPGFIDYGVFRSYYGSLTENGQTAYRCIYNNIFSYPSKIEIPQLTQDELSKVFAALKYDNPHIIFLDSSCSASTSAGRCYFLPQYSMDSAAAEANIAEMLGNARGLVRHKVGELTDYEMQLFIHDSLCGSCLYDDSSATCNTAYGAIAEKKALCMGYSYAYKLLLDMAGLESAIVTGSAQSSSGETVRHMWNVVKTNGAWYHTDTTWDDPLGQDGFSCGEVRHCYFNLTDSEILLDHSITDIPDFIKCDSVQDGYYLREGLFCENAESAAERISKTLVAVAEKGDTTAEFRFADKAELKKASARLFEDGGMYEILSRAAECSSRELDKSFIKYTTVDKLNVLIIFLQYAE